MVKKFTLGKQERLKSRKLIDLLFKEGKTFNSFPFRVYYLSPKDWTVSQPNNFLQFGVGVSTRNFKNATDRNRIKRLTREAYRQQKLPLQEIIQEKKIPFAVFVIYTGKELPGYEVVNEKITVILNRLLKTAHEIPVPAT